MTKAEKNHLNRVAGLGCIVCLNLGYPNCPAEIHHLRYGVGAGQRSNHYNVIPLCPDHHRNGGHGVAFHAGKLAFEAKFGTERELWFQVNGLLKEAA
ncbi:Ref family recombination enhancement nuclease [Methylophilus flavus]|uniref:Ref family recombination enhancement nuclease n=1 Tax=Methylophilus flavus TaxID=640084 RepID=A0ABW3P9I0_9PROT